MTIKNVIFDLGGVVVARDKRRCSQEFIDFFDFLRCDPMPDFWHEYDRGALTLDQAKEILCQTKGCDRAICDEYIQYSIDIQEAIKSTEQLIGALKEAGYKLYVLSNMSHEFIEFIRTLDVYRHFDGEVVSCEEHTIKPEPEIYKILIDRYKITPEESIFIDDRPANIKAANALGFETHLFVQAENELMCEQLSQLLLNRPL